MASFWYASYSCIICYCLTRYTSDRAFVNADTQDVLADADDVLADRCVVYSNSALVNADRRDVCRHISRDLALIGAQTYIVGACCCGNSLDSE